MRALVNTRADRAAVPAPSAAALAFHAALPGYAPTPLRDLPHVASELGLGAVGLKDETARLGLPAFKVLGASWAVERAVRGRPGIHTLVAASAGNHGRAVARVAAQRGLACRILLPARAARARREAIEAEGADVYVVDGTYEHALALAAAEATHPGVVEIPDAGTAGPARWVIDGYATLFAEVAAQGAFDLLLVPVGVGSLAAAAARAAAAHGGRVVGVEPVTAACLTASLAAGAPTRVPTPGTTMAGLDCAEVSPAAWPELSAGIAGTITVADAEVHAAMRELAGAGLAVGDCGAAPLAALRALAVEPECAELRAAVGAGPRTRVLLLGTEGPTDPDAYRLALAGAAIPRPSGM
ncbi:MAG TPA: pyridoxal-phosphate dependent enzyme [Solirubrobacteraceae bacterium]|nr:pyridoxal-phosphate dependent enzyme [Solirubrobacteraceae bacterium]